jgi:hypothetical protein
MMKLRHAICLFEHNACNACTLQGNVSILKQKDQRQLTDVSSVRPICVFYVFPCILNVVVLGGVPSIL